MRMSNATATTAQVTPASALTRHFSCLSNLAYTLGVLREHEGTKKLAICYLDSAINVALPFLGAALPSFVVGILASGLSAAPACALLALYVAAFQLLRVAAAWSGSVLRGACSTTRTVHLQGRFLRALLTADYDFLQTPEAQMARGAAEGCFYHGPESGLQALLAAYFTLLTNVAGVVVYGLVIGCAHPWLVAFLVAVTAPAVAAAVFRQRRAPAHFEQRATAERRYDHLVSEALLPRCIKEFQLYRMRTLMTDRLDRMAEEYAASFDGQWRDIEVAGLIEVGCACVRDAVVYAALMAQLFSGELDLPAFLLMVGMVSGFGAWAAGLFDNLAALIQKSSEVSGWRAFELSCAPVPRPVHELARAGQAHELRFEHVSYSYDGTTDAVHDLSLTIRAGEKIALVGPNGAGKTTLVKLACGLIEPTAGTVFLDGTDVSQIDRTTLFRELSVVFQDPRVFSIPLADNVACAWGAGEHEDARLARALVQADLAKKAQSLPRGIRTSLNQDLDERGVSLSGGETQRLMLARALYKDAPVVILDEPTAALDPLAEAAMYGRYDELTCGKTSVFISHRLASTRFCDRIVFLEGGHLAEEGSHEELMAACGGYARMFAVQARYYQDAAGEKDGPVPAAADAEWGGEADAH